MAKESWKLSRDPLYRGDSVDGVAIPVLTADKSIVRHLLYLEGPGRDTPYLSTSEQRATAQRFAGTNGSTYIAYPKTWDPQGVGHISRKELLQLLKGRGKGNASWHSAYEVMQAHKYVEEAQEHLADFSGLSEQSTDVLRKIVEKIFTRN